MLIKIPCCFPNTLYQIGSSHQQCQRICKCSKGFFCHSHCVWPSSGLVNADERRESQDQVPAGQQDFSASFTSIRSGVGCCKQQSRDTRWLADSLSLLAASHSLSQAVPPPFSYERSSRCLPSHSQIKTHDELGCPKESFNKMPCFKTTLGT